MIEYNLGKIWKTHAPRCPKNTFPQVFQITFFCILYQNGLNGVNINLLVYVDCGIFLNFNVVYLAKAYNH